MGNKQSIDYGTEVTTIDGATSTLEPYRSKVLLVVNTASACGFTPQFAGLEKLWTEYADRGLVVLGFPCNQFGGQDPGTDEEIGSFCQVNYGVTFPMHSRVDVKGPDAHPLFRRLSSSARGLLGTEAIKWNFTKFLVARDGTILERYAPKDTPEQLREDIEAALAAR